jgi:hypothetical protein
MGRNDISPLKPLDPRRAAFVKEYMACGDAHVAALNAGYAEGTARVAGTQLLEAPNIALEIARAARVRLARGIPMALGVLEHLAEHAVSERVRMDSATRLLDRAGLVAPKAHDGRGDPDLPLNELSLDALRERVERWVASEENDRAARAKVVTSTPDQTADLVG